MALAEIIADERCTDGPVCPEREGTLERGPTDCAVAKGQLQPPILSPDRGVLWGDLRTRGEKLAGRGGVPEVE